MKKYRFAYSEAMNGLEAVETYKREEGRFDYIMMGALYSSQTHA